MFDKKAGIQKYETSFTVSYMEIYKDEVYDLLVTRENVSPFQSTSAFLLTEFARPPNFLSAKMTAAWYLSPT